MEFEVTTNAKHTLILPAPEPVTIELYLEDDDGHPYNHAEYELAVAGGEPASGVTSAEGKLVEEVPPDATTATLQLWPAGKESGDPPITWELDLGQAEGEDERAELAALLANHGYDAGGPEDAAKLEAALRELQDDHGLPVTGEPDGATLAYLYGEDQDEQDELEGEEAPDALPPNDPSRELDRQEQSGRTTVTRR